MRDHARLVLVVALAACSSKAPRRGPDLQITGESTKLKRGEELPGTSPFFDGEVVQLRAAEDETVAIIVWRRGDEPFGLALEFDEHSGIDVHTSEVEHVPVPSASTRMYGPSRGAGDYPDKLVPATTVRRAGLIEIRVNNANWLTGKLTVGDQTFEVDLKVADVELADTPGRVWAYYDAVELARASVSEEKIVETFAEYGVAASPDLGLADWPRYKDQLTGLPYVPVYLPKDPAAATREVQQ